MDCYGGNGLKRDKGLTPTGSPLGRTLPLSGVVAKVGVMPDSGKTLCIAICPQAADSCIVNFDPDPATQSYSPVNQYGSKGFVIREGAKQAVNICTLESFSLGPEFIGKSEENDFTFQWVFWKDLETGRFFYGRVGGSPIPADEFWPIGTPCDWLSLTWDSTGSPVFAVASEGTFTIKRFVAGVPTAFGPYVGTTPVGWYNGELLDFVEDSANRDATFYYLRGGKVYLRFLRDNFGIEYLIAESQTTKRLTGYSTSGFRFFLRGFSEGYMGQVFKSDIYPPFASINESNENFPSFLAAFEDGEYVQVIVDAGEIDEETPAYFMAAFESLIYTDGVITLNPFTEETYPSFLAEFESGNYVLVVVVAPTLDEVNESFPSFLASFEDGTYFQVVISGGTLDEVDESFPSFLAAFESGTYQPA